jgi:hypothetical protein
MSKPSPDSGITPWINLDGQVAHPDSPRGGGGPGAFREAGSILRQSEDTFGWPHPRSPRGRRVAIGYDITEPLPQGEGGKKEEEPPVYLDKEVLEKAKDLVGKPTVRTTTPKGQHPECFDMLDQIYRELDAQHPDELTPPGSKPRENTKGDYVWGESISLSEVNPGDVLQLRDHKIEIVVDVSTREKYKNGTEIDDGDPRAGIDRRTFKRGHHTAVVLEVHGNGKFVIAEQHIIDPATGKMTTIVRKNDLQTTSRTFTTVKEEEKNHPKHGQGTVTITTKTTITVSGKIFPYRAVKNVPKKKKK